MVAGASCTVDRERQLTEVAPPRLACSGARYGLFSRDRASGEHVALEMAVVALGRASVGMAELALDVHQRVPCREPRRSRRMPQRVQWHVSQGGVSQSRLVPVPRDGDAIDRASAASCATGP